MSDQTIFHKILAKEVPSTTVFEDEDVVAFKDIHPRAKTHILFVPRKFVAGIGEITEETRELPGMLIEKARTFAEEEGIRGYKLSFNVGKEGGQEVPYLHLHFLSEQGLDE